MKKQETLQKLASGIVDTIRRCDGRTLRDIYTSYSRDKEYYYNRCYQSIQLGARNIEYGVYACGSWSFVFACCYDIKTVDRTGASHDLIVYKRFTRDTTTCVVYDRNTYKYYEAISRNDRFEIKIANNAYVIYVIDDALED